MLGNLDGEHNRVRQLVAPDHCDEETQVRGFSILCGAAAEAAVPFQDIVHPFGKALPETERAEWQEMVLTLLHLSDLHTFGQEASRTELLGRLDRWREAVRVRIAEGAE